jgi:SOS-response transcriptional repressor LexA
MKDQVIHPIDPTNPLTGSSCSSSEPFALQVLGDSMEPEFPDRCIVIIDASAEVENDAYVFAKYNDEYIFRQLKVNDGQYFLAPLNSNYETVPIPGLKAIQGKIIQRAGTRRSMHKHYE